MLNVFQKEQETAWERWKEWQKAQHTSIPLIDSCVSKLLVKVEPPSLGGDYAALLLFCKMIKIASVSSSANCYPQNKIFILFFYASFLKALWPLCYDLHWLMISALSLCIGHVYELCRWELESWSLFIWVTPYEEQHLIQQCPVRLDWNAICAAQ